MAANALKAFKEIDTRMYCLLSASTDESDA